MKKEYIPQFILFYISFNGVRIGQLLMLVMFKSRVHLFNKTNIDF